MSFGTGETLKYASHMGATIECMESRLLLSATFHSDDETRPMTATPWLHQKKKPGHGKDKHAAKAHIKNKSKDKGDGGEEKSHGHVKDENSDDQKHDKGDNQESDHHDGGSNDGGGNGSGSGTPGTTGSGLIAFGIGHRIANGDTTPTTADGTNFGAVLVGDTGPVDTFKLVNNTNTPINLNVLTLPQGYVLVGSLDSPIPAHGSIAFSVQLLTANVGTEAGNVVIANDSPAANPYVFSITGVVTAP